MWHFANIFQTWLYIPLNRLLPLIQFLHSHYQHSNLHSASTWLLLYHSSPPHFPRRMVTNHPYLSTDVASRTFLRYTVTPVTRRLRLPPVNVDMTHRERWTERCVRSAAPRLLVLHIDTWWFSCVSHVRTGSTGTYRNAASKLFRFLWARVFVYLCLYEYNYIWQSYNDNNDLLLALLQTMLWSVFQKSNLET